MTNRSHVLGTWRIKETEVWAQDALDLIEPAHLLLDRNGSGSLKFIAVQADVDYRVTKVRGATAIEFSFAGDDEGDQVSGRGWAIFDGEDLRGKLFIHRGDESTFIATREPVRPSLRVKATRALRQPGSRAARRARRQ